MLGGFCAPVGLFGGVGGCYASPKGQELDSCGICAIGDKVGNTDFEVFLSEVGGPISGTNLYYDVFGMC